MNWKSTGILLAAAAVLFAFIWLVDRPIRQQRLRQASRIILPGFDPASVNSVAIKPRGANEIHAGRMDQPNDLWRMTQPISYPAQGAPILALLDTLARLEWQERISAGELKDQPDAQEKFGFTQPQFEVSLQGSGAPHQILIGQSSALGDQVFLEVVGNPDIYLVSAAWLPLIPLDKDQWRDLSLLNPARLPYQSIQVRSPGRGFELERDPTNRLWLMKKPVTARADTARINELLQRLQGLRVRQFVSDDPRADLELYGLQTSPQTPELDLSFWRGSNLTAELQVGASPTNQPGLAFARRQAPGNVVVIEREALRPWQGAYTNFLDYHFISLSPDCIGAIAVQGEGRFAVQKQTNGQWQVRAETTFPADAGLMRDWLASFTNIQTQIEKTVATDLAPYGLTNPLLQYTLQADGGAAGPPTRSLRRSNLAPIKAAGFSNAARMNRLSTSSAPMILTVCRARPGNCATGASGRSIPAMSSVSPFINSARRASIFAIRTGNGPSPPAITGRPGSIGRPWKKGCIVWANCAPSIGAGWVTPICRISVLPKRILACPWRSNAATRPGPAPLNSAAVPLIPIPTPRWCGTGSGSSLNFPWICTKTSWSMT